MGNTLVARVNMNMGPWTTYDRVIKGAKSGDILLLSSRSLFGHCIRFPNKALWSHVGVVVRSSLLNEVFVMMAAVDRESLYACFNAKNDNERTITFGTTLQPLRAVLYSGLYNLVAVRSIQWRKDVDIEEYVKEYFPPELSESEFADAAIDGSKHDYITTRLLNLSSTKTQVQVNPSKFNEIWRYMMTNNAIFSASMDELACLVSADHVASIFFKLGIFCADNPQSLIPRFYTGHFSRLTPYKIPFNKNLIHGFAEEDYVYLDYQVWADDVTVRGLPEIPSDVPPMKSPVLQAFDADPGFISRLRLKSGDLFFFKEEDAIANASTKLTNANYTRVGMVVRFPTVSKVFILMCQPWYITKSDLLTSEAKLLEQTLVSLDSLLTSGAYSRVAFRRLQKDAKFEFVQSHVYTYLELNKEFGQPARERLAELYTSLEKEYSTYFLFDISCILSPYFIAMAYHQMGVIDHSDSFRWLNFTTDDWENAKLNNGFTLSSEEVLPSRSMISSVRL